MSNKRSLTHTRLPRSNVNSVVRSYLSPTPVGVGVGTSLIWAVHQTLLPARVWLRETTAGLGKAYEHHVGKALPTCSYTKNSLLTALVKLGWSVVSMIVFCAAAGQLS